PAGLAGRDRRSDRGGPAVRRGHRAAHLRALAPGLTAWAPESDMSAIRVVIAAQIALTTGEAALRGSPDGRDVDLAGDGGGDQRLPPLGQEGRATRKPRPVARVLFRAGIAVTSDLPLLRHRIRRRDSQ